jgi:hypothetical protein
MADRRKTTFTLDADLLRLTKIAAAREDKAEYQVVEDALRNHLGLDLLRRIQVRAGMDPEEAENLAVEEVRAYRRSTSRKRRP